MGNPWFYGVMAFLVPGGGHILQGSWGRGLMIGGVIWLMYLIGLLSGGAYYPGFDFKDGFLLHILNVFSTIGNGLGFLVNMFLKMNPPANVASWATFEYGGRFLEVAGLLNYLATIDAFDIAVGRKE
jgi:hypothetical protein